MSLRLRFLLSLMALLALMSVPALYGASRVSVLRDIVVELRGHAAQSALAVSRVQDALSRLDRYQRAYVATAEPDLGVRMRTALNDVVNEIGRLRATGYGDVVDEVALPLDEISTVAGHLEALVEGGRLDTATTHLVQAAVPLVDQAKALVPALATAIDAKTTARAAVAQRTAVAAETAASAALLIALGLAGVLALAAADALTRPVDRLRAAMAHVAEGAFEAPADLPYHRRDELGHLSRSFRTMTMRLGELDRLKAEFVGSASHDLKTPISVITGYAELMREELSDSLDARHRELLQSLAEQTQTLQRRVDQLLEMSRMEAGHLRLGLEEINLRHYFRELYNAFEPTASARRIRLELSVSETAPPFLIADPDVLRLDVLGNLLGNALAFTPAGGSISLSIRPDGERVHIDVADTGPGIPQDQVERIFEKYYQGRSSKGGVGLGLAIARAAVQAHGGRIEVQSRVGRGTRFRVTLPVRAAPPAQVSSDVAVV